MKLRDEFRIFQALLALTLLGACSTTPKLASNDMDGKTRAQIFLSNLEVQPATAAKRNVSCAVPAGSEKVSNKTSGASFNWSDLVDRATVCTNEKKWTTLESIANLLARNDIDSPWGSYFLSIAAEANGETNRALWMIDLAQKKAGGGEGLFFYQRAHILLKNQETARAMTDFEKALVLQPKMLEPHLFLAEIYQRDLSFDKATTHFQAALAIENTNERALVGLAEVKLQGGASDEASDLYQKAVSVRPERLQSWVRLAYIQESLMKNNGAALETYRRLSTSIAVGTVKEKTNLDLNAKIKTLEGLVAPARQPSQAKAEVEQKRSQK